MTLPAKKDQIQLFEMSEDPIVKRKQEMLQIPEVVERMTTTELMVVNASVQLPIKHIPIDVFPSKVIVLGKGILRDIGVKNWHDAESNVYILTRFADILSKHYPNLTLSDVKLAFEFMAVGHLDDHLQKDRFGRVEKDHYQDFSVEYYCKILNAYKLYRATVWNKAQSNVPKLEMKISEEQRKYNRNFMIQEIHDAFDNFKKNKVEPNFDLHIFIAYMVEKGLIEFQSATEESIKKAYNRLLVNGYLNREEKRKMIDKFAERKMTPTLRINAQGIENNKTIMAYFEKLVKSKKDIRDYLKKE